jgi:DHA2 family multidrug resistance protein-like MFS transporter
VRRSLSENLNRDRTKGSNRLTAHEWHGLPSPRRRWAIAALWLSMTMAVLDGTIANVALPAIARDIHASAAGTIWVVNAYQLAIAVLLLPMASLGETMGYARVFRAGLILFVTASVGCMLSQNLVELTLARAVQGMGAAGIMGLNGALMRLTFPHRQLGRMIGWNAMVISFNAAIGPSVASLILSLGPWPFLFAINLPIGLASLIVGWKTLPEDRHGDHAFDWTSALLNVAAMGAAVIGVDMIARAGDGVLGALVLAVGAGAGALLVRRSLGQKRPLVPIDLLRGKLFRLSVLTSVGSFTAQSLAFVALPFYFEGAMHRGQAATGLLMTPWPVAVGFTAPLAGRLADKYPAGILGSIGLAALRCGLIATALMPVDGASWDIAWRMALCGIGFGFFQAPNNRTLLSSAPLDRSGAAGGMLATARLSGQTIGATLTAIIFTFWAAPEVKSLFAAALFAAGAMAISLSRLDFQVNRRAGDEQSAG